ncbi:MAG: PorV/PorQ family protein [Ignavibacteriales bacterium]|nr:PorV/PorQ family protein [Ignavibacteriales bacterium]
MKKIILSLFILTSIATAQQDFKKTSTSGFVFLEIPISARTAALGETAIALDDMNSDAIFSNAGGLGFSKQKHCLSLSYSPWFADIKNYAASYSFSSELGVIAVGAILLDYGSMPRTVKAGQRLYDIQGTFNADALALMVGYSKMLTDRFSFGIAVKYAREKIDVYSVNNMLFDGGVLYYTGLSSLRIAATIQNFGTNAKYINDEFRMPSWLRLGAAAEVFGDFNSDYRVTTSLELVHASDNDERINAGAEAAWKNILIIRGGYKFNYDEETYSLGIGLTPPGVPAKFDVAYADYGRLGNILRFTIQLGML